jgi:hypothetical protein
VLDANIAIAALNGVDAVRSRSEDVPASEVGIPIVGHRRSALSRPVSLLI